MEINKIIFYLHKICWKHKHRIYVTQRQNEQMATGHSIKIFPD